MFDVLFDGIGSALAAFYSFWPSYGGAIVLLTLCVMVIMTPLTLKSTRSMMAMQALQPEMKKLQDRYRDDREKLNEELMAFYKENQINPLSGCLPLLLQMPVFIVLFQVLRGLTRRVSDLGIQLGWTAADPAAPTSAPGGVTEQTFDPAYVDAASDLYHDLARATEMDWLGVDLSQSTSQALGTGLTTALPYLVLIVIVGLSGWFQQQQTQARSTSEPTQQQKMMSRVMLVFLPVISFTLPGGIVLYFVVSNVYRIGQQWWITRTMPAYAPASKGDDGDSGKDAAGKDKGGKSGGDAKPREGTKARAGAKAKAAGGSGRGGDGRAKGSGSARTKAGTGRTTPRKSRSKTYTSDPRAKKQTEMTAQPRARKKRRK